MKPWIWMATGSALSVIVAAWLGRCRHPHTMRDADLEGATWQICTACRRTLRRVTKFDTEPKYTRTTADTYDESKFTSSAELAEHTARVRRALAARRSAPVGDRAPADVIPLEPRQRHRR